MIRGYVAVASPFVPLRVSFQRIQTRFPYTDLQFLLDTGAAVSVIHPVDAKSIGLELDEEFSAIPMEINAGIGGGARYLREMSWLEFTQADGALSRYRFALRIAVPDAANAVLPSILGMDFIQHFRLTVSVREERVELEPLF
mgnify:CR=1 FL=1